MLTTIQELEKEIDQFHKNIKDSNELINILKSIASLTKSQTESFDVRTKVLQDDLEKLPPELNDLFQKKIAEFVQEIHNEHQSYQTAVANLMEKYSAKISDAEAAYSQTLTSSMDSYTARVEEATESIMKVPESLDAQMQKDRADHLSGLKQIQEQYSADLSKTNEAFEKQLQLVVESVHDMPEQIMNNSEQQYRTFLTELEKMMDARLAQLADTEKHMVNLSQQLESKYDAFVAKLESTNMDQLYKYCQDMNKSINTKLAIALGGVGIAVIVSVISLFI